jgi:hypothetical protein
LFLLRYISVGGFVIFDDFLTSRAARRAWLDFSRAHHLTAEMMVMVPDDAAAWLRKVLLRPFLSSPHAVHPC